MTQLRKQLIQASDSPSIDAFDRWRVSNPETLFDSKLIFDAAPVFWDDQEVSGSGTTSSHSANIAASTLGVALNTAGLRVRQTFMSFNYQPGKSQLILMTGLLDKTGGGTGIERGWGIGDDKNGIFLVDKEGTINLRRRSYVTGSAVDTDVAQSSWNLDVMDGTGPSKITLDWATTQILVIDIEWLGVGRVRVGVAIDGIIYYVHEFDHANSLTTVYMSTPNLPLRYWIDNDGTGAASTMDHICSTVISEGGSQDLGKLRYTSTAGTHADCASDGTLYGIIGIRLKSAYIGSVVKIVSESLLSETADDFEWQLVLNPTITGTFTFNDVTNSAVQTAVASGATVPTITNGTVITGGYSKDNVPSSESIPNALYLGAAIDGTVDEIVLCVRPLSANLDIQGGLTWREIS